MRSIKIYSLSIFAITLMILMGFHEMSNNHNGGVFFVFVGTCTAIGLTIDMVGYARERIRKNNIRKLHP